MKKIIVLILSLLTFYISASELSYIDWVGGKIYSSINVDTKLDYNFPHNRLQQIEVAREKAKVNYFKIFSSINVYNSITILDYIEEHTKDNGALFSLINSANLDEIKYPNLNTVSLSYYINMYGDNSLTSIIMDEQGFYTEELRQYEGFHFQTEYTGIILDARGILKSFGGEQVKVMPSIFVNIIDDQGREVFNQYNVFADVIRNQGMVRYSYDINENMSDRIGLKPYKMVAFGVGDSSGSVISISVNDAKRILASNSTRNCIKNGRVVIVIDK